LIHPGLVGLDWAEADLPVLDAYLATLDILISG